MDRVTIDIDGGKLTLIRRTWGNGTSSRDMHKAPRMYVSVADGSVMEEREPRSTHARFIGLAPTATRFRKVLP